VIKTSKRLRNVILSTLLAGPIVLLGPAVGAQQYVPAQNEAVSPAVVPEVFGVVLTEPEPPKPGILSRTGAETMPLVRGGLAALVLGAGLVVLARRRREQIAAA
jgi:hypothetical protein